MSSARRTTEVTGLGETTAAAHIYPLQWAYIKCWSDCAEACLRRHVLGEILSPSCVLGAQKFLRI